MTFRSRASSGRRTRDTKSEFSYETSWHDEAGCRLWTNDVLSRQEAVCTELWSPRPWTALHSSLLMRAIPLWNTFRITPAWRQPRPGETFPTLFWVSNENKADVSKVVQFLTESPVKIPGAAYEPDGRETGKLHLGDARIRLHSRLGA